MDGGSLPRHSPSIRITSPQVTRLRRLRCWILILTKALVDGHLGRGGAGGNRTPVHRPMEARATTIPGTGTDAVPPAGRLADGYPAALAPSLRSVSRLCGGQLTFERSSPASVAGLRWIGPVRHCWSRCLSKPD